MESLIRAMVNPYTEPTGCQINQPERLSPFAQWTVQDLICVIQKTESYDAVEAAVALERAYCSKLDRDEFDIEDLCGKQLNTVLYKLVFQEFDIDVRAFKGRFIELTPDQFLDVFRTNEWFDNEGIELATGVLLINHWREIAQATMRQSPESLISLCRNHLSTLRNYVFTWLLQKHAEELSMYLLRHFQDALVEHLASIIGIQIASLDE